MVNLLNYDALTSGFWEEECKDADNDGGAAHDEEGEPGRHGVQVGDGGGQQRAQPGQGGAHACKHALYFIVPYLNLSFIFPCPKSRARVLVFLELEE